MKKNSLFQYLRNYVPLNINNNNTGRWNVSLDMYHCKLSPKLIVPKLNKKEGSPIIHTCDPSP
jgi:hypothetical protein